MSGEIKNIAYLYNPNNMLDLVSRFKSHIEDDFEERKMIPICLEDVDEQVPLIDECLKNISKKHIAYDLILIDYIEIYDEDNKSSLHALLNHFLAKEVHVPFIIINPPSKKAIESDIELFLNKKYKFHRNYIKYVYYLDIDEKSNIILNKDLENRSKRILPKIEKLENDIILSSAVSGKHYLKACLVPGAKENPEFYHNQLPFKKADIESEFVPDYFLIGGDYLLDNKNTNIENLPNNISHDLYWSIVYTKSKSDNLSKFSNLVNQPFFWFPGNVPNHLFIEPEKFNKKDIFVYLHVDRVLKFSVLNICLLSPSSKESLEDNDLNEIEKLITDEENSNSFFNESIKIVFCHYNIFDEKYQLDSINKKLEIMLFNKGFGIFIHDHIHEFEKFPEDFISINKSKMLRLGCGFFDLKGNRKSNIEKFFLTISFVYNAKANLFIEHLKIKIWSLEDSNFVYSPEHSLRIKPILNRFIINVLKSNKMDAGLTFTIASFVLSLIESKTGKKIKDYFFGDNESEITVDDVRIKLSDETDSFKKVSELYFLDFGDEESTIEEKAKNLIELLKFSLLPQSIAELGIDNYTVKKISTTYTKLKKKYAAWVDNLEDEKEETLDNFITTTQSRPHIQVLYEKLSDYEYSVS